MANAATGQHVGGRFALILAAFMLLLLLSWPILFSFELWVFKDRGNLLNLDLLLDQHLRPGVDTFYSYGLLPVALQRLAFVFGRGYAPMVGWTIAAAVGLASIWAGISRHLPAAWLAALLCFTPILLWVNPNFPYSLVLLSMLASIAVVLAGRLDLALVAASFGCWSVPSLPLVLVAVLLVFVVAAQWRHPARLVRAMAPGLVAYLATGACLAGLFGWRSVLATALPFQGSAFYAAKGYGLASLREFLSPAGAGLQWYFGTHAAWWLVSTALLFVLGSRSLLRLTRRTQGTPGAAGPDTAVVILAVLHAAFIFAAPGPSGQHLVYDPLLAAGLLLALATLPATRLRTGLLVGVSLLAISGCTWQIRETWRAWRTERMFPQTSGLYAEPGVAARWSHMLELSRTHPVFLLARPTGIHSYFPSISGPPVWFLDVGQTLPADDDRVFAMLAAADIVIEEPASDYVDHHPRVQHYLAGLCLQEAGPYFSVRQKRPAGQACKEATPR